MFRELGPDASISSGVVAFFPQGVDEETSIGIPTVRTG